MTLLVASIKEQQAIFLTDFQVTSKILGQKIYTDELNKFFKLMFNEHNIYFLTAGSVAVWQEIQKSIDISKLLLNKNVIEIDQAFKDFMISPTFKGINGTGGGFIIHHNTDTNNFMFYELEFISGQGASISQLKDGIFSLGSGSTVIENCEKSFHKNVWSREEHNLYQKKCNLESQIRHTFKPLNQSKNYFETTGVSENFSTILVEGGQLRFVNEEIIEGIASVDTFPKEQEVEILQHNDGTATVHNSLNGTNQIKSFGENLSRNGKKIERL